MINMARKPANAKYLDKTPTETHAAFAEYISRTTGAEVEPADVALVQWLYPLFLKSPAVAEARAAEKAAKEAEKAAKEAAKRAALQARLDKIEEQRAKLLAELGDEPEFDAADEHETQVVVEDEPVVEAEIVVEDDGDEDTDDGGGDDGDDGEDMWDDESVEDEDEF